MKHPLAKRLIPWIIAASLVGYMLYRTPLDQLVAALERARLITLMGWVLVLILGAWIGDTWATSRVFSWFLAPVSLRELLPVRAATYLMSILNYHLGQAGLIYYIHRTRKAPLATVIGLTLMMMGTILLLICAMSVAGVALAADERTRRLGWIVAGIGLGSLVYFSILSVKPAWLVRRGLLAPLFDAGIGGHLRATLVRIPHIGVIVATHLFAMRCFDILVPLGSGLIYIPLLLLVASIPATPYGLGTIQVATVHLFSRYARGDKLAREATALAYSLSVSALAMGVQSLLGLICLGSVIQLMGKPEEPQES